MTVSPGAIIRSPLAMMIWPRFSMSAIKHPIVADSMYGGKAMTLSQLANGKALPSSDEPGYELGSDTNVIERQALHASELYLRHPSSGKEMRFEAPLPEDMKLLILLLERYRSDL